MSHPDIKVFSANIPQPGTPEMDSFNQVMAEMQDRTVNYVMGLAKELGVPENAAWNIHYLRTRSRWSQNTEDRLIKAAKAGTIINTLTGEESEFLAEAGY